MATLIDSLGKLDHSIRRKFKKVFSQLNDDYIVRTPAQPHIQVSDLLIEGPKNHWLLLGLHSHKPQAAELGKYQSLATVLRQRYNAFVRYLAITDTGDSIFDKRDKTLAHLISVEGSEFFAQGADLIEKYTHELPFTAHQWLKKQVIAETTIRAECTTRRELDCRDNTAQLRPYFLDYDQEKATKLDMIGAPQLNTAETDAPYSLRLINGVAGCGKTLILINRAILYCKIFPQRRVLFLIHNKPITLDIEHKFVKYLKGAPKNLTIKTFHAFALAQQKSLTGYVKPLFGEKSLKPVKENILGIDNSLRAQLKLSDNQLWSELEYINQYLIESKQVYLSFNRQGRGFPLQKAQRECIWQLYEQAMGLMASRNGYLPSLYIRQMCLSKEAADKLEQFDHILLDEAQFFYPSWLQLVLKSLKHDGQLFMCADPNQGFLKSRLSWKQVGLNVRGRTLKLNYSYRTTYEILLAATSLLEELQDDPEDFIRPDLANMSRGSKPQVIYSGTPQDELKRFLSELKEIVTDASIPLNQVMVLCSQSISTYQLKASIDRELGMGKVINCNNTRNTEEHFAESIKLMSINSCTGMEAGITFVLGVGELLNAENNLDLSPEEKINQHQESLRRLYVAMTRAGQKLILFSTEKLPQRTARYLDEK